jgi:hypothetical protein
LGVAEKNEVDPGLLIDKDPSPSAKLQTTLGVPSLKPVESPEEHRFDLLTSTSLLTSTTLPW